MELRQLEAFVAIATELHFGRAAEKLGIGQPTLSDMVRRLEREFGTALLTRTTRRVSLTPAGEELLGRAKVLLDEVAATKAAVRRIADGLSGTVRLGITPPVAAVLAPHLRSEGRRSLPDVEIQLQRMWLPDLTRALTDGVIDVALTCGRMPAVPGVVNAVFCSELLLVGLRPDHPLAAADAVALPDLGRLPLGLPSRSLFPNWALAQQQALNEMDLSPPTVELESTDLSSSGWTNQHDADWVFVTTSLGLPDQTTIRRTVPELRLPYTLQWRPERAPTAAVGRFVRLALTASVPSAWRIEQDHLHSDRRPSAGD